MSNKKKFRMTKQKKVILEILRSTDSHPTADWIYEQARKKIPDISLGTVYRNLNFLKNMGEILELNYGSSFSRYDGNAENHYHFKCEKCGKVYDLDIPVYDELEKKATEKSGHDINYHRLEFYGICKECKESRKK